MAVTIKLLEEKTIPLIMLAFQSSEWKTTESYFQKMLTTQKNGEVTFLVAYSDNTITGFVYVRWQAEYPPFAKQGIPEIRDLRVLAEFRRRGIASALMDEAEERISKRSKKAGLGVGLYADYGPAQQMYILRGYVPDGRGLIYQNRPVKPGRDVFVDDDLLLFFIKERK